MNRFGDVESPSAENLTQADLEALLEKGGPYPADVSGLVTTETIRRGIRVILDASGDDFHGMYDMDPRYEQLRRDIGHLPVQLWSAHMAEMIAAAGIAASRSDWGF